MQLTIGWVHSAPVRAQPSATIELSTYLYAGTDYSILVLQHYWSKKVHLKYALLHARVRQRSGQQVVNASQSELDKSGHGHRPAAQEASSNQTLTINDRGQREMIRTTTLSGNVRTGLVLIYSYCH